jgi:hypothetical protein
MASRRRLLWWTGAALAAGVAGCSGSGSGDGADDPSGSPDSTPVAEETTPRPPDTTGTGTTPETTRAGTTTGPGDTGEAGSCTRPTPRPIPDLRLYNRTDERLDVTVAITPDSGSEHVYRETVAVPPGEETDRYDVFPAEETYRVVAILPDGRSGEGRIDGGRVDRYGIATVTVTSDDVWIERLGVHPETTATPCPG